MRCKARKLLTLLVAVGFLCFLGFLSRSNKLLLDVGEEINEEQNKIINKRFQKRKEKLFKAGGHVVDLTLKKDWHDYKAIAQDEALRGPGEQGKAVALLSSERQRAAYQANGFNIEVSNRISLNRSLSDIRHKNCRFRKYLVNLPTTSIIIPFHNEGWSTLFRTLNSILNRSPPELLHEIVLIDDYSSKNHLKEKLDKELMKYPKVKLFRMPKREGLIRARLAGIEHATGDVVVILDSHIEATHNWLPPLLEPIALDRKTLTCPMIDIIDKDNFRYLTQPGDAMRGAFDWELYYKRIPIPHDKRPKDPSDPFEDPIMAGGLFAADRSYFREIGQYDPGLEIWGGEQYELSFKVWMCGGKVLDSPCSRVGHIYRQFMPYSMPKGTDINKNFKRVAEVWMDEYKEYFYNKRPHVRRINPGDLSQQKKLRKDLHCKSFDWFMTEVAPDIIKHYPPVLPKPAAWGRLYNEGAKVCLDALYRSQGSKVATKPCVKGDRTEQKFLLTWKEDIRPGSDVDTARPVCLDGQGLSRPVVMWDCHGQHGNQLWKYKPRDRQLVHALTGYCAAATDKGDVLLVPCHKSNEMQRWTWGHVDDAMLTKFNAKPYEPA